LLKLVIDLGIYCDMNIGLYYNTTNYVPASPLAPPTIKKKVKVNTNLLQQNTKAFK